MGVRRGGFLNYRQWPVKVRLAIFAFVLVSFWSLLALFCMGNSPLADKDLGQAILGIIVFFAVIAFLVYYLTRKVKGGIKAWSARKRAKKMESVFNTKRQR